MYEDIQDHIKNHCLHHKKIISNLNLSKSCIGACRGTSRGSVWLSWQTYLHCRYSALKPIKHQTSSLQVS